MKNMWREWVLAFLLAWALPWVILAVARTAEGRPQETVLEETEPEKASIPVLCQGEETSMLLEDYLTGVLMAEMPASFPLQARMAQAVVARTYALRTVQQNAKHPGFVCDSSGCCQGYLEPVGPGSEEAREAVRATEGLVLTYGGKLIEATYFSASGGRTEDAVAVWGSDVPYLQSVESPGEDVGEKERFFTKEELEKALGLTLTGSSRSWLGKSEYTQGGGVESLEIMGVSFPGTELRFLLGLRSTAFTVEAREDGLVFRTRGFGHRVGMSQYGAQAMALAGKDFQEILLHYYTGAAVTELGK